MGEWVGATVVVVVTNVEDAERIERLVHRHWLNGYDDLYIHTDPEETDSVFVSIDAEVNYGMDWIEDNFTVIQELDRLHIPWYATSDPRSLESGGEMWVSHPWAKTRYSSMWMGETCMTESDYADIVNTANKESTGDCGVAVKMRRWFEVRNFKRWKVQSLRWMGTERMHKTMQSLDKEDDDGDAQRPSSGGDRTSR